MSRGKDSFPPVKVRRAVLQAIGELPGQLDEALRQHPAIKSCR